MDIIFQDGSGSGAVADMLLQHKMDTGALRPYVGRDGRGYVTMNKRLAPTEKHPEGAPDIRLVGNANTTLLKDEWKEIDKVVKRAARPRLRFVADIMSKGLVHTIGNGMGKTVLENQRSSDVNDAAISMDGLDRSERDRPVHDIVTMPLPIISKDFSFTAREIAASRDGGSPLDMRMVEECGRKIGEMTEKLAIGVADSYQFGGGSVYGAINFPSTLTKTITSPEASGWTGETFLDEILAMKAQSQAAYYYGPWSLYVSPSWDKYLDADFKSTSDITLRERIAKVDQISSPKTLDYLTGYKIMLVQDTSNVFRMIDGLKLAVIQWDGSGGLEKFFKVLQILVPQPGADFNGNTGIVYGTP